MPTDTLRILLVEDHPFQLIALQILLNNHGLYRVTPALNAEEALVALERSAKPYDVLLCDQRLPDMSGTELIDIATQRKLVSHAVLLSGLENAELKDLTRAAVERGVPLLGCLSKPLNTLELLQLISSRYGDC
ncbi:response regulator [Pseudomonas sp. GD03842]|uniref:response regulator n=1 Tax=unclassified Pseudomonas TaxID=196821 RepID=UPI000D3AE7F9|nr:MULTISPECIES: response regulator [unclassified Pseudomonas]MDH0747078.1 response regulator [Pseudomonas sp. GD03842]RAU44603.1 response regulator [Pseudomonas sp. RIT 409]RAU54961.1 response regulator [Pseudomonas sp. RIT 412]